MQIANVDLSQVGDLSVQAASVGTTADRILEYLRRGSRVLSYRNLVDDRITGEPEAIPNTWFTDGSWLWHQELVVYASEHDLGVPEGLLAAMQANDFRVPNVAAPELDEGVRIVTSRSR